MTENATTIEMNDVIVTKELPEIKGFIQAIGRRKTATARVRISDAKKMKFTVNGREGLSSYFPTEEMMKIVQDPFIKSKIDRKYEVSVMVSGGGIHAQAEAIRHGIARALVKLDSDQLRPVLKKNKFLKRDPRTNERKKFGLKKARKSAQWSKR